MSVEDFISYCRKGQIDCAKSISQNITIDICTLNDEFIISCEEGHLEIAKWLYQLSKAQNILENNQKINQKININAENDNVSEYELHIENNIIQSYNIIELKDKIKDKSKDEIIQILKIKTEKK